MKKTNEAPPPVTGRAKLLIEINDFRYTLRKIEASPEIALVAWRLTKSDGRIYDVRLDENGFVACDCFDFLKNREGKDPAGCKHCRALKAVGLL